MKRIRIRYLNKEELPHYSKKGFDVEYLEVISEKKWTELASFSYRGNYDTKNLLSSFFKDETTLDSVHLAEFSLGIDRLVYFLIHSNLKISRSDGSLVAVSGKNLEKFNFSFGDRLILALKPIFSPYLVAVMPMTKNESKLAREVFDEILISGFNVIYDDRRSIGKRYRRQDEIGTYFCITVDHESLVEKTVTIRERDFMTQIRIPINRVTV